jgi:hypothetical protein
MGRHNSARTPSVSVMVCVMLARCLCVLLVSVMVCVMLARVPVCRLRADVHMADEAFVSVGSVWLVCGRVCVAASCIAPRHSPLQALLTLDSTRISCFSHTCHNVMIAAYEFVYLFLTADAVLVAAAFFVISTWPWAEAIKCGTGTCTR